MKKILTCLLATCFGLALLSSCSGKTQVAQAAADVESIAADIDELVKNFPAQADITDADAVEKMEKLSEQSTELQENIKKLSSKYAFVTTSDFGGISVNEEELAKLSEAEKADTQLLRDAVKRVQDAYVKLIEKSSQSIQNTFDSMDDGSSLNPGLATPDPLGDAGDDDLAF